MPKILSSDVEDLEVCYRKLSSLASQLSEADDPLTVWDSFTEWTETSAYSQTTDGARGGLEPWETYQTLLKDNTPKEEDESASGEPQWSSECDAVFSDMNSQFETWDGSNRNRGAWWGSARPGSISGATKVPNDVVLELKKRVGGTGWRFSDSFSGGISFHRARGKIDFIYHMLPSA